jgi:hypothetical protein
MTFKEAIRDDISSVFMDTEEFAALHTMNGKTIPVLIDNNELIERSKKAKSDMDGVNVKTTLIFVKARDYGGGVPPVGYAITLDGVSYRVTDAMNEDGVYSIHLEANRN